MKFAMSLVAIAGLAAAANAATSNLAWTVSVNGGPYVAAANAVAGDTLTFRLRVSLTGNSGVGSIAGSGGLAGFNFLPTLSNFGSGDTALPLGPEQFPEGSASNPHAGVFPAPVAAGTFKGPGNVANSGRLAPFGANGTNTTGVASSSVTAGVLSWRAAVIGNAGVSLSQLPSSLSGVSYQHEDPLDPTTPIDATSSFARTSRNGVDVFAYTIVVGESQLDRTLVGSSSILTPVQWYTSAAGASNSTAGPAVTEATVIVPGIPAPGALALLGLGGLVATRRRR